MLAISHSVEFKMVKPGSMSTPHLVARSAECAGLFGRNKSPTKPFGQQAGCRGHPMGSHSRFLTVQPLTNLLFLSFCYRSIRWRLAISVRPCVWRGISIGRPLPTVKPWLLPEFRTESSQSTQCRFREERSSVLSRAVHTTGVWRGRRTVATSFSPRLVGSQRTVRFGRYPSAGVSQHACSSVKGESNL